MRRHRVTFGLALSALIAAAGAANAQTAPQPASPESYVFAKPVDLALPAASLGITDAQAEALRRAGVTRTAIDHRFSHDGVTGSLGFLCGLPADPAGGVSSVRGFDPQGRFLGAKISFPFR